jgi:hypothetical protein
MTDVEKFATAGLVFCRNPVIGKAYSDYLEKRHGTEFVRRVAMQSLEFVNVSEKVFEEMGEYVKSLKDQADQDSKLFKL